MKKGRMLALLMAVLLLSAVIMPGYSMQSRANTQIATTNATILKKSNGELDILFSLRCQSSMDVLGVTSIVVQRFNGTSWVSEYTFNIREYPKMQINNKSSYSATLSYSPDKRGAQYRAMVFFYARNSSGSDTAVRTTGSMTA